MKKNGAIKIAIGLEIEPIKSNGRPRYNDNQGHQLIQVIARLGVQVTQVNDAGLEVLLQL